MWFTCRLRLSQLRNDDDVDKSKATSGEDGAVDRRTSYVAPAATTAVASSPGSSATSAITGAGGGLESILWHQLTVDEVITALGTHPE